MVIDEVENQDKKISNSKDTLQNNAVESTDISKNTIIVLVILTVIISVVGTFVVMFEMNNIKTIAESPKTSQANVQLKIIPPGSEINKAQQKELPQTTGKVSLNILPVSKQ